MKITTIFLCSFLLLFMGCKNSEESNDKPLFEIVNSSYSNINFNNKITESEKFNYFTSPYFFNGGGIAVGDINNDGLNDIFFTGNQVENKLYLNKGDLVFQDISQKSNVQGGNAWYSGVTFCDVNNDGYLDIYVCVSGTQAEKKNELYINNKDLTFTEMAAHYGIADDGASIQSVFFDFDNDNDLDLYVANYPFNLFSNSQDYYYEKINNPSLKDSDRLYENTGDGKFVDITEKSGILNFGLSIGVISADLNNDGFQDIYVSNDFETPDFLYINNGDGTFKNTVKQSTAQTSFYGMGVDVADFNNDGLLDIVQLDMNPEDNRRSKENMASMNPAKFNKMIDLGFHFQYMQNSLQINQGNLKNRDPYFSNIARLAGVSSTDWSWAPLIADFDNDGWKDLYITNGSRKDINNKDFYKEQTKRLMDKKNINYLDESKKLPSEKIDNYIFKNNRDYTFIKSNKEWGISFTGFSNGASYSDLDNDGDLEIIINNIDSTAIIYKNNATELKINNYLRFQCKGPAANKLGLGVKITLENEGVMQYQELTLTRGFQSSIEPFIHFGLGKSKSIEKATVVWPDGALQILKGLSPNQLITVDYKNASKLIEQNQVVKKLLFKDITDDLNIDFVHKENDFNDFNIQPLLPHKYSNFGPSLAVGDINNDQLDDFYVGGASGQSGELYLQTKSGNFTKTNNILWDKEKIYEDIAAEFFDADGDGDNDLYIVSGGYEFKNGVEELKDRLYINDGKGNFSKQEKALPNIRISGSCVVPGDYDNDGDIDLFIGGRVISGKYPFPAKSYLLENNTSNGTVLYKDVTNKLCPQLDSLGLVTSAIWSDFDNDDKLDLIVVGEWMPVTFFKNTGTQFLNTTIDSELEELTGWWYSIEAGDFDNDGDDDFLVGNLGLNYKYKATMKEPFEVFSGDFDFNGSTDIVLGYYNSGQMFPVRGKQCSTEQIPNLEQKFPNYKSFASASLIDVYGEQPLQSALHYKATTFASGYIENVDGKKFIFRKLSNLSQLSSVNSIIVDDFDNDGNLDAIIAGNLYASEVETPRNDAGEGLYLKGDGKGNFEEIPYKESGFFAKNDTKHLKILRTNSEKIILVGENNSNIKVFRILNR